MHTGTLQTFIRHLLCSRRGFRLQKVTEQGSYSLPSQMLSPGGEADSETRTRTALWSTATQCCFPKIRPDSLTPLLKTLPGPPITRRKSRSPSRAWGQGLGWIWACISGFLMWLPSLSPGHASRLPPRPQPQRPLLLSAPVSLHVLHPLTLSSLLSKTQAPRDPVCLGHQYVPRLARSRS